MFAVFLDVDGVLNTRTTVEQSTDGHTGIDDSRVEILAYAIRKCGGGKIVLTSDWKSITNKEKDYEYLCGKLAKYGLEISNHTADKWHYRGEGIQAYLETKHLRRRYL